MSTAREISAAVSERMNLLLPLDSAPRARLPEGRAMMFNLAVLLVGIMVVVMTVVFGKSNEGTFDMNVELLHEGVSIPKRTVFKCDDILLGAWVSTCFVVPELKGVFPGRQGVLSYPILISRAADGGFDFYGYSVRDPFFGGNDYLELSHGTPSRVESPTPTSHCMAPFKSKLRIGKDWSDGDGDYYWNRLSHDTLFAGTNGKDVTCVFRRLYGSECREARATTMKKFARVNNTVNLPSENELCG